MIIDNLQLEGLTSDVEVVVNGEVVKKASSNGEYQLTTSGSAMTSTDPPFFR